MIGTLLRQRYKIIQKLGQGGFGETYFAEDRDIPVTPKPICVIKRLQPAAISPDIIRLFEKEAQTLYKLGENNPQIPKLYAYFQENQNFYLIQEFIDGQDLSQEITPGKRLSESYVIKLLQEVLEVLAFVHNNNVIHRDIKPQNIIRPKDKGKLVLIDFGAVKEVKLSPSMKTVLSSRSVGIGTPGYTPLEQGMGKPKFSSDIYALGMTAIQALTGIYPHELPEDNDGEIIWRNQVSISVQLEQILTRMIRCDFRQRYTDATEALNALNKGFLVPRQPASPQVQNLVTPPVKRQPSSATCQWKAIKVKGKYLVVRKGEILSPFGFDYVRNFSEGLASVGLNRKYGYIDSSGNLVIPCQFDYVGNFSEGLALVSLNRKYGYIDSSGNLVIPCQFDYVGNFSEGLAYVGLNGKVGYIDSSGNLVIPYQFDGAENFSEGLASVRLNGKFGYIDTNGKIVIPCQFDEAYPFSNNGAKVKQGGKFGYIDKTGRLILPCIFDLVENFSEGMAVVRQEKKYGYIDSNYDLVIPCHFDNARAFSHGLAMVGQKKGEYRNGYGFINKQGNLVVPCELYSASSFSEGLARVTYYETFHYAYINTIGKPVISSKGKFKGCGDSDFSEGLAGVKQKKFFGEEKWGFIDQKGKVVIPCKFDKVSHFTEGLAPVNIGYKWFGYNSSKNCNGQWGYIDKTGKLVIPCQFDIARHFQEGFAIVLINKAEYLIDKTGKIVY